MTRLNPQIPTSNILIVDDNPENLRLLSEWLTVQGHKVRKVKDGQQAVQAALLSPPDLILLDIMMPSMNGYEVCRQLKAREVTSEIPVIFLSVNDDALNKVQAFRAGGVDYVTKPFDASEVLVRVETQLKLSRLQKQVQEQNLQLQQEIASRMTSQALLEQLNPATTELPGSELSGSGSISSQPATMGDRQLTQPYQLTQLQTALAQAQTLSSFKSQLMERQTHVFQMLCTELALDLGQQSWSISPPQGQEQSYILPSMLLRLNLMQQALENGLLLIKAEAQQLPFKPQPLELITFCQEFIRHWQRLVGSGYTLGFSSRGQKATPVLVDANLLHQLLQQLVGNALIYSPGTRSAQLSLIYEPDHILLQVQDQGIGVPASEQKKVFDRFYRASNATAFPGMGLGLAVVKLAVDLHQGSVTLISEPQQGTTVIVSLPMPPPAQQASPVSLAPPEPPPSEPELS